MRKWIVFYPISFVFAWKLKVKQKFLWLTGKYIFLRIRNQKWPLVTFKKSSLLLDMTSAIDLVSVLCHAANDIIQRLGETVVWICPQSHWACEWMLLLSLAKCLARSGHLIVCWANYLINVHLSPPLTSWLSSSKSPHLLKN